MTNNTNLRLIKFPTPGDPPDPPKIYIWREIEGLRTKLAEMVLNCRSRDDQRAIIEEVARVYHLAYRLDDRDTMVSAIVTLNNRYELLIARWRKEGEPL